MFASESPSSYGIDREKCYRTVPMRVLVLGLSRTGTECEFHTSMVQSCFLICLFTLTTALNRIAEHIYIALRKALVHLGYNDTYHGYAAAVEYPRDCELWLRAMRAKYDGAGAQFVREDWDRLLGHYQVSISLTNQCESITDTVGCGGRV